MGCKSCLNGNLSKSDRKIVNHLLHASQAKMDDVLMGRTPRGLAKRTCEVRRRQPRYCRQFADRDLSGKIGMDKRVDLRMIEARRHPRFLSRAAPLTFM